jgi:hypothetical protein
MDSDIRACDRNHAECDSPILSIFFIKRINQLFGMGAVAEKTTAHLK